MAISRKKLEAWNKVIEASRKVAEYRGLPFHEENYYFDGKDTIKKLEWRAEKILSLLTQEIPLATDKQLNFLSILLDKPYNSETNNAYMLKIVEDATPNKYQVSELIGKLKEVDQMIFGGWSVTQDDFVRIENEINEIISLIK